MARDCLIQVRVSAEEKEQCRKAALKDGKPLTDWCRDRLLAPPKVTVSAIIEPVSVIHGVKPRAAYGAMLKKR